ncbi:MAG: prepilin-type N-terminal cleavage/methylation domain-containing protein [Candidatus Doudnabacteria bacterium]
MKQITSNREQEKGFTLIEVMISVAIFSIIAYGIVALVSSVLVNSSLQGSLLANNDSARRVAFTLIQELRDATTSDTGGYALESATAQQLIFYTNAAGSVNRIRYFLQMRQAASTGSGISSKPVLCIKESPSLPEILCSIILAVKL